jgi:predicted molibdopterin-dependent oxidoreductase YjgC
MMDQPSPMRLPSDENISRGPRITFKINGTLKSGYLGESIATVLLAEGIVIMRTTTQGQSRGVFCGMGVCFDCLVVVDGIPNTRACMTWIKDGMDIQIQNGLTSLK